MKNKTRYTIILVLMILASMASLILSFVSLEEACGGSPSGLNGQNGCTIVNTSQYEYILGFKVAHLGLIAFPILTVLTILELKKSRKYQKRLLKIGITLGALFAIYLIYLQLFVIKAICKYCMVADIGVLISLGIILLEERKIF